MYTYVGLVLMASEPNWKNIENDMGRRYSIILNHIRQSCSCNTWQRLDVIQLDPSLYKPHAVTELNTTQPIWLNRTSLRQLICYIFLCYIFFCLLPGNVLNSVFVAVPENNELEKFCQGSKKRNLLNNRRGLTEDESTAGDAMFVWGGNKKISSRRNIAEENHFWQVGSCWCSDGVTTHFNTLA